MNIEIILPTLIAFTISIILCPLLIPFLEKLKFGQQVRDDGPESHLKKSGTPTMGGVIFILSILITSLLFVGKNKEIIPVLLVTLAFGLIGFLDDYIKILKQRSMGLKSWQKLLGQIVVTGIFAYYLLRHTDLGTALIIPFTSGKTIDVAFMFIPLLFLVVLGTVNGANFTDGIDGLASSVTIIIAVFFTVVSFAIKSGLSPITSAVTGGLLGFLIYNVHPAKVFMGDTGSLALGGFVAATAYMLQMPLFLIIVALIYLIEVLSVIIQVGYFKISGGKRIFRMAPIHHHFELLGWSEPRVVTVFSVITALLCLMALIGIF